MKVQVKLGLLYSFLFICIFLFVSVIFLGCKDIFASEEKKKIDNSYSMVSWNVQTFFNAIPDGTEYSDFLKTEDWTESKYRTRLTRLCECIESFNADILVLQEIESDAVIYDIVNNLRIQSNLSLSYKYATFSKEENSSLGCAVLSRVPILSCEIHHIDIRDITLMQPSMRPLMEVLFDGGLTVFVVHWKSKSGTDNTDFWRSWQENLLATRINELGSECFIACGDFNKNIDEFSHLQEEVCLTKENVNKPNIFLTGEKNIFVYSPWLNDESKNTYSVGSYFYDGSWEYIDNFFSGSEVCLSDFSPIKIGSHVTDEGKPYRYSIYSGQGYSDHLPIKATISY